MGLLLIVYLVYLLLYVAISYAVLFHLVRYRIEGDKSYLVLSIYTIASLTIMIGSVVLLRPI